MDFLDVFLKNEDAKANMQNIFRIDYSSCRIAAKLEFGKRH